jgi:anti-sigma factor RsiW
MTTGLDCARARQMLVDDQRGRLDTTAAAALATHLDTCADCRHEDAVERVLTEQLEQRLPLHAAPLALKRRLAAHMPPPRVAARRTPDRPRPRRWILAVGAAAAVVVVITLGLLSLAAPRAPHGVTAEAVNDHLRVLARAGALDERSGDVHKVRPWFAGRLDFAPVIDFGGDDEFPLRGSTVDYFLDRRAAVVVYAHGGHTLTLLVVRPEGLPWPAAARSTERGFNVRLWRAHGLGYALISDVEPAELTRLAARLGG